MAALGVAFVVLLLPAGYVAFVAFVIVAFEVGDRFLALLALLVAGVGMLCAIAALVLADQGKPNRSMPLIIAAFLIVVIALVGVSSIPTHGE